MLMVLLILSCYSVFYVHIAHFKITVICMVLQKKVGVKPNLRPEDERNRAV